MTTDIATEDEGEPRLVILTLLDQLDRERQKVTDLEADLIWQQAQVDTTQAKIAQTNGGIQELERFCRSRGWLK